MILSSCVNCGESKIVSWTDGSLQDWEHWHYCASAGVEQPQNFGNSSVPEDRRLALVLPQDENFAHHANRDGTADSTCKHCFVTICTSTWETDLTQAERSHVCDPNVVARWKAMLRPNDRDARDEIPHR